jgi:hypothetical protein
MKNDTFKKMLAFLERLAAAKIPYRIWYHVEDAVSVEARAPGEHWEIDFFADGEVYVERFKSNGHVDDESILSELFALCADDEAAVEKIPNGKKSDHVVASRSRKALTK